MAFCISCGSLLVHREAGERDLEKLAAAATPEGPHNPAKEGSKSRHHSPRRKAGFAMSPKEKHAPLYSPIDANRRNSSRK